MSLSNGQKLSPPFTFSDEPIISWITVVGDYLAIFQKLLNFTKKHKARYDYSQSSLLLNSEQIIRWIIVKPLFWGVSRQKT